MVADVYSRCLIPRCLYRNAVTSVSAATAVCSRLAALSVSQLVDWDLHTGTNVYRVYRGCKDNICSERQLHYQQGVQNKEPGEFIFNHARLISHRSKKKNDAFMSSIEFKNKKIKKIGIQDRLRDTDRKKIDALRERATQQRACAPQTKSKHA